MVKYLILILRVVIPSPCSNPIKNVLKIGIILFVCCCNELLGCWQTNIQKVELGIAKDIEKEIIVLFKQDNFFFLGRIVLNKITMR